MAATVAVSRALCILHSQMKNQSLKTFDWLFFFFQLSQEKILKIMNMVKNKEVSIEGALHLAQKEVYAEKVRPLLWCILQYSQRFWRALLRWGACLDCCQGYNPSLGITNSPVHHQTGWVRVAGAACVPCDGYSMEMLQLHCWHHLDEGVQIHTRVVILSAASSTGLINVGQNYGMFLVGRDLKAHLVPPPCTSHYPRLLQCSHPACPGTFPGMENPQFSFPGPHRPHSKEFLPHV